MEQQKKEKLNVFLKIAGKTAVVVLILIAGSYYGLKLYGNYSYKNWAEKESYEAQKAYLEDYYGGSTPEETMRLFLDALKNNDVDLALKYFYLNEQKKYKNYLTELKNKNELQNHLTIWEENFKNGIKSLSDNGFSVYTEQTEKENFIATDIETGEKIEMPAGTYRQYISFQKNQNGTWKIINL